MTTCRFLIPLTAAVLFCSGAPATTVAGAAASFVPLSIGLAGTPQRVEVGDLDGDGDVDLMVLASSRTAAALSVLRNDGGVFTLTWSVSLAAPPFVLPPDLELGDLDGDGDLDVFVNVPFAESSARLNAGDGTFAAIVPAPLQGQRVDNELGDLDGDGALDLAVCELDIIGYVGTREGNGDGSFDAFGPEIPGGSADPALRAALGDVTGDGLADLVTGSATGLELAAGDATGGFPGWSFPVQSLASGAFGDVALADLDGDGRRDVIAAAPGARGVAVLFGLPAGGLGPPVFHLTGPRPDAVAVADFGNDGLPDVAVTDLRRGVVSVLIGTGSGALLPPADVLVARSLTDLASADLDGDGDQDLVVTSTQGRVVLLTNCALP